MLKRLTLLVMSFVCLAQVYARVPGGFSLPEPGTYALPRLGSGGDGWVLNESGQRVRLHQLLTGHVVLLSFVYTRCSDAGGCPLASAVLKQALSRLSDRALSVPFRAITLSFDPVHDTPDIMRRYGETFKRGQSRTDWQFLTTASPQDLAPLLSRYGQLVQSDKEGEGVPQGFSHLLKVMLLDERGDIRNIYSASLLDADILVHDVLTLEASATGSKTKKGGATGATTRVAIDTATTPADYGSDEYRTNSRQIVAERAGHVDLMQMVKRRSCSLPPVRIPSDNPLTRSKIALGRKLFFDRRLSMNGTISCANCHVPAQGFANNEMATAVGIEGRTVRRNAPGLFDVDLLRSLFLDGRENSLETQVWSPLLARNEMAAPSVGWVIQKLESLADYRHLFERAFGRRASMETIGQALASFERILIAGDAPFDRWRCRGERTAMSDAAQRGFKIFTGKGGCSNCHSIGEKDALLTDQRFHNTGLAWLRTMKPVSEIKKVPLAPGVTQDLDVSTLTPFVDGSVSDLGRYEVTFDPADRWTFRTPSLRNVALTAPYMHDGSLHDLRAVIDFYDKGGIPEAEPDPLLKPLGLSDEEKDELLAFLNSLNGENIGAVVSDADNAPIGDPLD